MDYFASVELELTRAMRRRGAPRLASRRRRLALVAALCAVTAGTALAATGVIPIGTPVHLAPHLSPLAGSGVPARGGSRLLSLTVADPEGGPPWGMRVIRTTRGLLCLQVAREQDGRLGELGVDGAFHDDGRFHPLPAGALPDPGSELGQGFSEIGEDVTCHLPGEAFIGFRRGVERSAAGPADTLHRPRAQLRDIYFGLLGRQAESVTYSAALVRPVVPGLGAFLFVTATGPRDQIGGGGGSVGSAGGIAPVPPLSAISYRFGDAVCERLLPRVHAAHPCPPPQSLYRKAPATPTPLHVPLRVSLRLRHRTVAAAVVGFQAPFAVTGAAERYELRVPIPPCRGPGAGYAAQETDRDIAAGASVVQSIGYPFASQCGRRTARIQLWFDVAGHPSRQIGTVLVRRPAGTRARQAANIPDPTQSGSGPAPRGAKK